MPAAMSSARRSLTGSVSIRAAPGVIFSSRSRLSPAITRGLPYAAAQTRAHGALDCGDRQIANIFACAVQRDMPEQRIRRAAPLPQNALARIRPERDHVERKRNVEIIDHRQHAAIGCDKQTAAILDD